MIVFEPTFSSYGKWYSVPCKTEFYVTLKSPHNLTVLSDI